VSGGRRNHFADLPRREVVRAQVHSVGAHCQRDVRAGIDEKNSSRFPVLGSQRLANGANRRARKRFQLPRGKVLLAQLDVIHAASGSFPNLFEQEAPAIRLIAGELRAIGNVVQKQGQSGVVSRPSAKPED
jgi:hypothetical protein